MNNKKKYLSLIILLILVGIYFYFNLLSLFNVNWLPDEVYHIRFINEWFLKNFNSYFFQLKHENYPPMSPVFGNPPFAMAMMTLGMYVGDLFNIAHIYSARFVNFISGLLSFWLLYLISKKIYRGGAKYYSLILYISLPLMIVLNTTAYLDSILILLTLAYFYFSILFLEAKDKKFFILSAIFAGLAFITKYQFAMIFFPSLIFFFIKIKEKKIILNNWDYIFYFLYIYLTGAILWAGIRDLNHVINIFSSLSGFAFGPVSESMGLFSDYTEITGGILKDPLYYLYMFLGKSTIPLLLGLLLLIIGVIFFSRKYADKEELFFSFLFLTISLIPLIVFGLIKGVPNSVHRIGMIFPFVILLSGYGYELISRPMKNRVKYAGIISIVIFVLLLLGNIIVLSDISPKYYNHYTNNINKIFNKDYKLYINGDGEGMKEAAEWFDTINSNPTINLGIVRLRYVFKEYTNNTNLFDFPMTEGLDYALSKDLNYIVMHKSYTTGGLKPVFLNDKEHFKLVHIIKTDKGEDLVYIYKVVKQ